MTRALGWLSGKYGGKLREEAEQTEILSQDATPSLSILFMAQVWRGTIARMRCRRMRAGLVILRAYRRYKVKAYVREVNRRFKNVRAMKDHGRHVKWPTPPKVLRRFEEALKNIHSRDLGLQRAWDGNYLKRDSPDSASSFTLVSGELQRKDKFMRVLFSGNVRKINHFHKAEDRSLLITDRHLYKMDPLKQYKPMKSIPLYNGEKKPNDP
ncbi:hypothetical protein CRUP_023238 [Coryphaenoides rupestris]|nr:hypothetical protein CRUP_023238 [Coryphaenoides rupestris]